MKKATTFVIAYFYYNIHIKNVNTIIDISAINPIILADHFNQVEYSTFANVNPPMIAPQVGVNKFTNPFAATKIIIFVSTLNPNVCVSGAIIGVDNVAIPDDDGTNIDSTICSK